MEIKARSLGCLVLGLLLAGCASTEAIYRNYDLMVRTSDGVTAGEAKIMAQKEIIGVYEQRDYRITAPDIKTTPEALKYPDYWFVVFGHNWFSPMSTDPLAKTYTELRETVFLVVIEKATGQVKFSGMWFPKRAQNFDWIFSKESLRLDGALTLPPSQKATPLPKSSQF